MGTAIICGLTAWSGPAPFAVPSVDGDVPLPGCVCGVYASERDGNDEGRLGAHRAFGAITRPVWALLHDGGG
jgi:hypothetical protein